MPKSKGRKPKKTPRRKNHGAAHRPGSTGHTATLHKDVATLDAARKVLQRWARSLDAARKVLQRWARSGAPRARDLPTLWAGWCTMSLFTGLYLTDLIENDELVHKVDAFSDLVNVQGTTAQRRSTTRHVLNLYQGMLSGAVTDHHTLYISPTPLPEVSAPVTSDTVGAENLPVFRADLSACPVPVTGTFGMCVHGSGTGLQVTCWGMAPPDNRGTSLVLTTFTRDALDWHMGFVQETIAEGIAGQRPAPELRDLLVPFMQLTTEDQVRWRYAGRIGLAEDAPEIRMSPGIVLRCLAAAHMDRREEPDPASAPAAPGTCTPRDTAPRPRSRPQVRVIDLSVPHRRSPATGERGTRAEPDHRWVTPGHWRNQPCGPGRKERKRIWVAEYENGPQGKPLRAPVPTVRKVDLS